MISRYSRELKIHNAEHKDISLSIHGFDTRLHFAVFLIVLIYLLSVMISGFNVILIFLGFNKIPLFPVYKDAIWNILIIFGFYIVFFGDNFIRIHIFKSESVHTSSMPFDVYLPVDHEKISKIEIDDHEITLQFDKEKILDNIKYLKFKRIYWKFQRLSIGKTHNLRVGDREIEFTFDINNEENDRSFVPSKFVLILN